MFKLSSHTTITTKKGKIELPFINEVEIKTSVEDLTDTATVTIARKVAVEKSPLADSIRRGDSITIKLGYDNNPETLFEGYILKIKTGTPLVLECENTMYLLKQIPIKPKIYKALKLKSFLDEYFPSSLKKEIADVDFGTVRIDGDTTLAKVLNYFTQNYPVRFFFRDNVFYGTLPNTLLSGKNIIKTHRFSFYKNVISDTIDYTPKEDVKLLIKAKCITNKNKKLLVKYPNTSEDGAEVRTLLAPQANSEDELRKFAQQQYDTYHYEKMEGSFETFGLPLVKKGDIVHMKDEVNESRNDKKYFIKSVAYKFGQSGYRQTIELNYKA